MDKDCEAVADNVCSGGQQQRKYHSSRKIETKESERPGMIWHIYFCDLFSDYTEAVWWMFYLKEISIPNFKSGFLCGTCHPNSRKIKNGPKVEQTEDNPKYEVCELGLTPITPDRYDLYMMDAKYKGKGFWIGVELETLHVWISLDEEDSEFLSELEQLFLLNTASSRYWVLQVPWASNSEIDESAQNASIDTDEKFLKYILGMWEKTKKTVSKWVVGKKPAFTIDGYIAFSMYGSVRETEYILFGGNTLWGQPIDTWHILDHDVNVICYGDNSPRPFAHVIRVFATYEGNNFIISADVLRPAEKFDHVIKNGKEIIVDTKTKIKTNEMIIFGESYEKIDEFAKVLGLTKKNAAGESSE